MHRIIFGLSTFVLILINWRHPTRVAMLSLAFQIVVLLAIDWVNTKALRSSNKLIAELFSTNMDMMERFARMLTSDMAPNVHKIDPSQRIGQQHKLDS